MQVYCIVFFNAEATGKVTGEQNKTDQITSQSLTLCLKKTAKKNRDGRNQKDKILARRRSTQIYRYYDLHSRHKSRGNTENYYTVSADGTLSKSLPLRVRHLTTENALTEKIASTCYVLVYLALCAFFLFLNSLSNQASSRSYNTHTQNTVRESFAKPSMKSYLVNTISITIIYTKHFLNSRQCFSSLAVNRVLRRSNRLLVVCLTVQH